MPDYCALIKKAQSTSRNFPEPWFSTSTGYDQDQRKPKCATTFQRSYKERSARPGALSLNKCGYDGNSEQISTNESAPSALILPEPYDDPSTLLTKLEVIANTINNRESVAAATGLYVKTEPDRNPEKAAVAEMTVRESEVWKAYLRGTIQLPEMNWEVNQEEPPISKKPLKNARRRAEALNRLYKTDQAQPGHSMWFTKRYTEHLPLIRAMARIIGKERYFANRYGEADTRSLAELQSIRKIISSSTEIRKEFQRVTRFHTKAINTQSQVLVRYKKQLEVLRRESKKRAAASISHDSGQARKRIRATL